MSNPSETIQIACPHCGTVLETEESIAGAQIDCPECGKAFLAAPIQPEPVPTVSDALPKSPRTGRNPKKKWAWILAVVLVLVAGGAAMWWHKRAPTRFGEVPPAGKPETEEDGGRFPKTPPRTTPFGSMKDSEAVRPTLSFQLAREYCKKFGGRVEPEAYSFDSPHASADKPPTIWSGIPMYFMNGINVTWVHREARPGGKYVLARRDQYIVEGPEREEVWTSLGLSSAVAIGLSRNPAYKGNYPNYPDDAFELLRKNAFSRGIHFPAPVAMADNQYDTKFFYLNEAGNPSILRWGPTTNCCFWCFEGRTTLKGCAQCLRELRETLAEYTSIAQEEGLNSFRKPFLPKHTPDIYIGDLEEGTREKAVVEYEFLVENDGREHIYRIKQIAKTKLWTLSYSMTMEQLDEELAFFSRFESDSSIKSEYSTLYCYLTQQKILFEEAEQEAERIVRRFEGGGGLGKEKKEQTITFQAIGPQSQDARIELEATAESGGKVVFSIESGPGTIDGKVLTFTDWGTVVVRARQWGNDEWKSATATQEVKVKENDLSEHSVQGGHESPPPSPPPSQRESAVAQIPKPTTQTPDRGQNSHAPHAPDSPSTSPSGGRPELQTMSVVLGDLKANRSAANLSKLEKEWKMLPPEPKRLLQKNVMWISGTMLLQHGKTDALAQRKALLDIQALTTAVSDECPSCYGRGKRVENCRTCGGTGRCAFCHGSGRTPRMNGQTGPCPKCNSSGRCLDCSGGKKESRCRTCGGSGRMLSEHKCQNVIDANIAEALRICRGEE